MFCQKCGNEIADGAKFCTKCGATVGENNNVNKSEPKKGKAPILLIIIVLVALFFGKDYIMNTINQFKNGKSNINIGNNNNFGRETEKNNSTSGANATNPGIATRKEKTFTEMVADAKKVSQYGVNSTVEDFDTVKFGKYYNNGPSKTDIEWIVLDKNISPDGRSYALLTSKYVLNCVVYNARYEYTFWETSNARMWLNNNFYNDAFSSSDKEKIIEMPLLNPRNIVYPSVEGGNSTIDKVFLLNCDECRLYFGDEINGQNSKLATKATEYAVSQGAYRHISDGYGNGNTMFWLRSPGNTKSNACDVSPVGYLNYAGNMVNISQGIRPTIYVWY